MLDIDGLFIAIIIALALAAVVCCFLSFKYGYSYRRKIAEIKIGSAEEEAQRIIEEAKEKSVKNAEAAKKEQSLKRK